MGTRRQAREQALSLLYQVDLAGTTAEEAMRLQWGEEPPDPDVVEFARLLVRGVTAHQARIDEAISAASTNWKIGRMSYVDRNILRVAVFEMMELEEVPPMVSVNEAIELGKRFGTSDSGSFINGVLDRVARNLKVVPDRKR